MQTVLFRVVLPKRQTPASTAPLLRLYSGRLLPSLRARNSRAGCHCRHKTRLGGSWIGGTLHAIILPSLADSVADLEFPGSKHRCTPGGNVWAPNNHACKGAHAASRRRDLLADHIPDQSQYALLDASQPPQLLQLHACF
jgi:hypothetical protein